MKAILTRYLGPTDHRGARILAKDGEGNKLLTPVNQGLGLDDNHQQAAYKLRDKMGWNGDLISGWLRLSEYAHVFTDLPSRRRRQPR